MKEIGLDFRSFHPDIFFSSEDVKFGSDNLRGAGIAGI
jgi:hypothetical protein